MIKLFLLRNRFYENRLCDHPKVIQAFSRALFLAHHSKNVLKPWKIRDPALQESRVFNKQHRKNILGEDNIAVPRKDKNITRNTFCSLLLPVWIRSQDLQQMYAVVWCELLGFVMAVFATALPGQLWHGPSMACVSEKAQSWSCQASKVRCRITWALILLTESLLESPLCRNYLQGMGFSCILSSILHTAKSDSDCILLCWVNSRYPRGTDGLQELCWIELQAPSCSWVRIYLNRECCGEGWAPTCTVSELWFALVLPTAGLELERSSSVSELWLSCCSEVLLFPLTLPGTLRRTYFQEREDINKTLSHNFFTAKFNDTLTCVVGFMGLQRTVVCF